MTSVGIRTLPDGTRYTHTSAHFGQMSWPRPDEDEHEESLEWRLRYGTPTQSDLLSAAGYVAAYGALVHATETKRRYVVRTLRAIEADEREATDG
jgi:hypothetical protein